MWSTYAPAVSVTSVLECSFRAVIGSGGGGRMVEEADSSVCTYARIATTDAEVPTPLTDYWHEPSSSFIIPGAPAATQATQFMHP